MDLIQSFSVDHTLIVPGIFLSREDKVGSGSVTTYDIRLKRPNREPVIDVAAMHSLEHLIATFLRNDPEWKDEVIYWGPMGCLTGFYLILKGRRSPQEIYDLVLNAFKSVADAHTVPGAAAVITSCTTSEWQNGTRRNLLSTLRQIRKRMKFLSIPEPNVLLPTTDSISLIRKIKLSACLGRRYYFTKKPLH